MGRAGRVAVIINPVSGTRGRIELARARADYAAATLERHGIDGEVLLTEHPGHARELADAALGRGAALCVAWGGDGTVNEVASALAFRDARLAIVPSGSGNGLARELGIPFEPARAFDVALGGRERCIDAGELDGHFFFNVAGLGLDAGVAHRFAAGGLVRRGFLRYVEVTAIEVFAYRASELTVIADGTALRVRPLIVAIANGRQYGNGALIAPSARIDDGQLDLVIVDDRMPLAVIAQAPRVFTGGILRVRGVTARPAAEIRVIGTSPLLYHVDGEPFVGAATVVARAHPRALRVLTSADDRPGGR